MRRLIIILPAIVVLLIGALIAIAVLIPKSVYRTQIQTAAEASLGREVNLDGPISLSFFPRIAASVSDVTVANPDGFSRQNIVEAGQLRASVKWGPLLTGSVRVQEMALIEADVELERLEDGRSNWEFGDAETDTEVPSPAPEGGEIDAGFDQIRIVRSNLTYSDAVSETAFSITDFDLAAEASSLSEPLKLNSSGLFDDNAFNIALELSTPNALLSGETAEIDLEFATDFADMAYVGAATLGETQTANGAFQLSVPNIAALADAVGIDPTTLPLPPGAIGRIEAAGRVSGAINALAITFDELTTASDLLITQFNGDVALGGEGNVDGALSISSENLRGLLTALAVELTPGDTLQTFSFRGNPNGSFETISIDDLNINVDDTIAEGSVAMDLSAERPKITGALSTSDLDLTPFMGPTPEEQPEGWSKTPLALESLTAADADISLESPSIKIDKMTLSNADIRVQLNNGRLNADIAQLSTFGGRWSGTVGLDAARSVPRLSLALTGDSILMEDLMQTLAGLDRLSGVGQFSLDISSVGASIHDIMNNMDGELSADLADGALKGFNLGQLFRTTGNLREALTSGNLNLGISPNDQTDFASFDTLLSITDGVADIRALDLVNSALSARGDGTIDLGAQTLNMGLQFAADTTGQGQLSDVQLNGLPIPLRIAGSWTSPSIAPDTGALTQALAGQQIDRLTESLGGDVGGALSGILGNQNGGSDDSADDENGDAAQTPEEAIEDAARNALGGLFRRD